MVVVTYGFRNLLVSKRKKFLKCVTFNPMSAIQRRSPQWLIDDKSRKEYVFFGLDIVFSQNFDHFLVFYLYLFLSSYDILDNDRSQWLRIKISVKPFTGLSL